jgi:hypothetical protein
LAARSHHRRDTASSNITNNNITSRTHNNFSTNKVARLGNDSTNKTLVAIGDEVLRRPQQLGQFMAATDNPHKPRRIAIGTKNADTRPLNAKLPRAP